MSFNLEYKKINIDSLSIGQELFYITEHSNFIHKCHVVELKTNKTLIHNSEETKIEYQKARIVKPIKIDDLDFFEVIIDICFLSGSTNKYFNKLPDNYFLTEKELRNHLNKVEVITNEINVKSN